MLPLVFYFALIYLPPAPSVSEMWAMYDEDTVEFQRVAKSRVNSGQWKRLTPGTLPPVGALVFAFGTRAARSLSPASARVVEVFVGGRTPLVSGHDILPWEPPVQAVTELATFLRVRHPARPICVVSGPRTQAWAQEVVDAMPPARVVNVPDLPKALAFVSQLYADPSNCTAVVLAADFEVLDFPVVQKLLQLQIRAGIPLVGRTRHEVLFGAVAAVEPYREDWVFPPQVPADARIFMNGAIWRFLKLPKANVSKRWEPLTLGN